MKLSDALWNDDFPLELIWEEPLICPLQYVIACGRFWKEYNLSLINATNQLGMETSIGMLDAIGE
jgi:hypothetical protein